MKTSLPGLRFGSIIKATTTCDAFCSRLLYQCQAAMIERIGGKIGIMTMDPNLAPKANLSDSQRVSKLGIKISATPASEICNNLCVNYAYNAAKGIYEGQLRLNRDNHDLCRHSYYRYGETTLKYLDCPDVQSRGDANVIGSRFLSIFSHRHDLIQDHDVAVSVGFDIAEGAAVTLELPEAGWTNEKCILVQRTFMQDRIRQTFWRVGIAF
jgi:hypothetical protein